MSYDSETFGKYDFSMPKTTRSEFSFLLSGLEKLALPDPASKLIDPNNIVDHPINLGRRDDGRTGIFYDLPDALSDGESLVPTLIYDGGDLRTYDQFLAVYFVHRELVSQLDQYRIKTSAKDLHGWSFKDTLNSKKPLEEDDIPF